MGFYFVCALHVKQQNVVFLYFDFAVVIVVCLFSSCFPYANPQRIQRQRQVKQSYELPAPLAYSAFFVFFFLRFCFFFCFSYML